MEKVIINDSNLSEDDISYEVVRVKALMINSKGKLLLAHNNNTYQLPGGHLEENEELDNCLIREIKEETGINIISLEKPFLCITTYDDNYFGTNKKVKNTIYYYRILTDMVPDFSKTHYDELELATNFDLFYVNFKGFDKFINKELDGGKVDLKIAREMLLVYEKYNDVYNKKKSRVLVTGGCGYIGTHTCVELLDNGYDVVVLDNLSNSQIEVLDKIEKITGKRPVFYEGDMIDGNLLDKIFEENEIDSVIDFAAYKAVGESVSKPIEYYKNNVATVLELILAMKRHDVKKLVFSSSATVYGNPEVVPITEDSKVGGTTNPYGTSKLFVEQILKDLYNSDNSWYIAILRYFNPIGAHESGLIGEKPNGVPANLMPYVAKVAKGELECLSIFGDDYDTEDGTGVRDYVHVVDLAIGHIKALEKLDKEKQGLFIYNLGTGVGYSVLDIVKAFESANGIKVNYRIAPRRDGDIDCCYSDTTKAREELGFVASKSLEDMCRDAWNFEKNN